MYRKIVKMTSRGVLLLLMALAAPAVADAAGLDVEMPSLAGDALAGGSGICVGGGAGVTTPFGGGGGGGKVCFPVSFPSESPLPT